MTNNLEGFRTDKDTQYIIFAWDTNFIRMLEIYVNTWDELDSGGFYGQMYISVNADYDPLETLTIGRNDFEEFAMSATLYNEYAATNCLVTKEMLLTGVNTQINGTDLEALIVAVLANYVPGDMPLTLTGSGSSAPTNSVRLMVDQNGMILLSGGVLMSFTPPEVTPPEENGDYTADEFFTVEDGVIIGYDNEGGGVNPVIPPVINSVPVTGIANEAFWDIETVVIPDSVTSIEFAAFWEPEYESSDQHRLPEASITLGTGFPVFYATNEDTLTGHIGRPEAIVSIPLVVNGVDVSIVGEAAFSYCYLTDVTVPEGFTSIQSYAFAHNDITELSLPEGLLTISTYAFGDNTNMGSITIPSTVTSIGYGAFINNPLTSITLPAGLTIDSTAMGVNGASFATLYMSNGQLAGTYVYDSGWSLQ